MTEDVYTFISVPEKDAPYHMLFQKWLETNRNWLKAIAMQIGTEPIVVVDDVLDEGLYEMNCRATQIEEES